MEVNSERVKQLVQIVVVAITIHNLFRRYAVNYFSVRAIFMLKVQLTREPDKDVTD